uniref:Lipase (EC) n=1 Tax=uncultured Thiotrichaceae bacterium TaxID=298394 RepID=A0A6S6UBW8_9GAMM|nr:MAG: Lipase (EC [uncultured Thiotrichaceae bacterium]
MPIAPSTDSVILLHGLARSNRSFARLEVVLNDSGYHTVNYNYPSTRQNIEKLAEDAIRDAVSLCPADSRVNFVTHSMGGILLRQYLSKHTIDNLGRVVMLGPPNKGSEVVDQLKNVPGFKAMNGPAGMQLGTDSDSVPKRLGAADFDVGIIAGTSSINLILSTMMPRPNDGKVSVESTKLEGMNDHLSVSATHTFMTRNSQVMGQVIYYLQHGFFER